MSNIEKFEYVFLGGGKGGKSLAIDLATAGRRVAVIEAGMIGGSCINVACIPSKALIQNARIMHTVKAANILKYPQHDAVAEMHEVHKSVRSVVEGMIGMMKQAFETAGFDFILGSGRFVGPRQILVSTVEGGMRTIEGDHVFINTGTVAAVPNIPGLYAANPMTHVELLQLDTLPEHLIVIGAGYIGLEMAQAFRRLGSDVTLIERSDRIANREDPEVSGFIHSKFDDEGIAIRVSAQIHAVTGRSGSKVTVELEGGELIAGSHLLIATGRRPRTEGIGLETAGVDVDSDGFIRVDERLATTANNVWAIGEVARTPMFTHASYDDYRVLKSILIGRDATTANRLIPYTVFLEPELGRIGLNETQARKLQTIFRVATIPMSVVPRARTNQNIDGLMKVIVDGDSDQILGFTMLGSNAGEVLATIQVAMLGKVPYTTLRDAIFSHPTMAEGLNILFSKIQTA